MHHVQLSMMSVKSCLLHPQPERHLLHKYKTHVIHPLQGKKWYGTRFLIFFLTRYLLIVHMSALLGLHYLKRRTLHNKNSMWQEYASESYRFPLLSLQGFHDTTGQSLHLIDLLRVLPVEHYGVRN